MARIRTTKPEFWTDGDVMDLSPHARMLFHGSWNFTLCDYGHLPDDPRRLKMQVLPADEVMLVRDAGTPLGWAVAPLDPFVLVDEIVSAGRYARLTIEGRSYLHVVRFTDHQRLETRWTPRCPACKATSPDLPEPRKTSREVAGTRRTSAQDRTVRDGTSAAAAAEGTPQPPHPVDELPAAIEILRNRLESQHRLFVRWDKLNPAQMAEVIELIELHGDAALVTAAQRAYRSNDPIMFAQGWLSHWRQLRPPGASHIGAVPDPACDRPGHNGTTRRCNECASEALAGGDR